MRRSKQFGFTMLLFALVAVFPGLVLAASVNLSWNANQEADLAGYNVYYGTSSRHYGAPVSVGKVTGYALQGLEAGKTYYFSITALDTAGNESGFSAEVKKTVTASGTTDPTPTELAVTGLRAASGETYTVGEGLQDGQLCYIDRDYRYGDVPSFLAGASFIQTANDDKNAGGESFLTFDVNQPVTVYVAHDDRIRTKPSWLNGFEDTGADLTTDVPFSVYAREYAAGSVVLGDNGASSSCSMYTVMLKARADDGTPQPQPDTTAPSVALTSPVAGGTYTSDATRISLAGTASDNVNVVRVRWQNSAGGSGTATGTTSWSVTGVPLVEGTNTITVTAVDAAGNEGQCTLVVTCRLPDTTAPAVSITRPTTRATYDTTSARINLAGTAGDDKGVTAVKWTSSNGGSGTASGTGSWSITGIGLAEGQNVITVTARDAAGNEGRDSLTVNYAPASVPGEFSLDSLTVRSGRTYALRDGMTDGALCYIDRSYQYGGVPSFLEGAIYLQTANDDKYLGGYPFISFDVNQPVTVYVAHDDRIRTKPLWLRAFQDTGADLTTDVPFSIYAREYPAGSVLLGDNGASSSCSMYTVMVVEKGAADDPALPQDPAEPLSITNLTTRSGQSYVLETGLENGVPCYIDRDYAYSGVPSSLLNLLYLKTANDDKEMVGDELLSFEVNRQVTLYVAHDDRIGDKPDWLVNFVDTGLDLETDAPFSVYAREFPAGTITLGGNGETSNCSMYTVLIGE